MPREALKRSAGLRRRCERALRGAGPLRDEMAMSKMPAAHAGIDYYNFIGELSGKRDVRRYFEIGVNAGTLMSQVRATVAVGVDPGYVLSANVTANKVETHLYQETSDAFFAARDFATLFGGPPDLAFLDGLHQFEYLLRDFYNTEAICSRGSLICMHDCMPLDDVMTIRHMSQWVPATKGTAYDGSWTGDVWKVVPILRQYRPDLRLLLVDCPPTGVVCVTGLDPHNTLLRDNYLNIVKDYNSRGNTRADLEDFYASFEIVRSADILLDFDSSLFFAV